MSWQRPNIGSRMNREVHVRFWERAEVKFLRATRQSRRTTMFAMSGLAPTAAVMLQCHDRSKSAMCGRLRVGKDFLHARRLVGAAMCSASHDGFSVKG